MIKKFWQSDILKFILIIFITFLILLDYFHLSIFPRGKVDPNKVGTLADWITGSLTAFALIIGIVSLNTTRQDFISRNRREENIDFISKCLVYVWIEPIFDSFRRSIDHYEINILNDTNIPIYYWSVAIENSDIKLTQNTNGILIPKQSTKVTIPKTVNIGKSFRPSIEFTTPDGNIVVRDYAGKIMLEK